LDIDVPWLKRHPALRAHVIAHERQAEKASRSRYRSAETAAKSGRIWLRRQARSRLAGGPAAATPKTMETRMSKRFALYATAAALAFAIAAPAAPLYAQMAEKTVNVGGAPMYPSKNIIQNAVNSKDHTTLVAAVKAAGLVDTLSGPGPFTVFAPTNAAFAKLPAGTVDNLLKPENKATLTKVLMWWTVPAPPGSELR
jgi:hypothetical protein